MAVIESNNRILRAGDSPVGTRYFDGDYIHIDEYNRINFTGDFSGLSSKVDACCADAHGQISAIKGSVSSLSSQFVDCCSNVNTDLTELWSAVNENSANKLDKSAFNNFIENGYYPTINTLYDNDNYLSAVIRTNCVHNSALNFTIDEKISGISGIPLVGSDDDNIWISGTKYIGESVPLNFGDTIQVISSFTVSGDHNHAISLKGSQFTLPSTASIQALLDDKLDISSFTNYTGEINNTINGLFDLANSAYTTALNNYYNKADKSAMTAYVPYSAISGDDNIITGINGSALSAGTTYTEGPNIKITGTEISGRDWSNDITAASSYAYEQATANVNIYDVSAGDNVDVATAGNTFTVSSKDWSNDITAASSYAYEQATAAANVYDVSGGDNINVATADNIFTISGRNWSTDITAASSYAYEQATANITAVDYATSANISNSALTANYALSSDSATYDSDGNKITETYLSAIPGDVITTASVFVSSVNNLTPEIVSGGINGHELKLSGSTPTGLPLSGLDPIKIEKTGGKVVISLTGDVGHTYDVSASANISVATAGDTFVISGRDWSDTITAASSYAYEQATANDQTYNVSGGTNINVATAGNTFTISGKDWQNDITAASSYAYSQATADAQGKIYSGIAPIVVNNTTDQISADCTELIAGDGIEFVTAATGTTINCTASGVQLYRNDQGHIYPYESLTITNRRKVSLENTEMGYMVPGAVLSSDEGKVPVAYYRDNEAYFLLERITGLLPTSNSFNYTNILQVNAQGVPEWVQNPVQAVATSADATATNVLYIVTGS